ncbi:2-phospho-L-lactate guanylyltransferase [Methanosarcina siciliae C2J]|uniref:2-phospho-L-lactate guanylyltransferase n=3 Tax=Methanosarcina siciliae TaxID=38027 RepID=A0A0E3PCP4_9EURY|nr:2-phospho-L-lactate guanylyltransferase [Methanosarcina siciliae]AKB28274.1 2-phospho-L-lactate guanylyltransferase [Methanosarcina siciliae T4/M]AKB32187.1 2-phospho-L-lactate guanylyltransferase [Methanosarcina siciliae HI350]AKB36048.1 2-phospho-L-lactate guanylyltransferase [Methanosarcina siciliae C2J]
MRAVIPYKKAGAKSRLSPVLSLEEREEFVELMLNQVIDSLRNAEIEKIDVLSPSVYGLEDMTKARVLLDEDDLNEALNRYLAGSKEPVLIVMADLPLLSPAHIKGICSTEKDVCIVPGKGGGTNALFIKNPSRYRVKYYGSSFLTHCSIATDTGQDFEIYDSFLAGTDIDEPEDLVELLIHGNGSAKEYINRKFRLEVSRGRVGLVPL